MGRLYYICKILPLAYRIIDIIPKYSTLLMESNSLVFNKNSELLYLFALSSADTKVYL